MLIGLTGQTGAGKSTVSALLLERGFAVIDADECSHEVTQPGKPCLIKLREAFGEDILDEHGALNRKLLAKRAFSDADRKKTLETIIFPFIIENIEQKLALLQAKGYRLVILDAPTLFESGVDRLCDQVISVTAPREIRFQRIMRRDAMTPEQANLRMDAQLPEEFYRSHSRHMIENAGSRGELAKQVEELSRLLAEVEGCQTDE